MVFFMLIDEAVMEIFTNNRQLKIFSFITGLILQTVYAANYKQLILAAYLCRYAKL